MRISLLTKRVVFVVFLGGIIAAGCALPGYETDAGLSASSSSSSGTATSSSGGGKDNVGGAGGSAGMGGAGGEGGAPASGVQMVKCKDFYDQSALPGSDCSGYVVAPGTPEAAAQCAFAQASPTECCSVHLECVYDGASGKTLWKESAIQKLCGPINPNCPLGCKLEPDGKTCPQAAPTTVNVQTCSCFNANIKIPAGNPPPPLPLCVYEADACVAMPQGSHPVLACKPGPNGGPIGKWEIASVGCCVKDQQTGKHVCGSNAGIQCEGVPSWNAGDPYFVCPAP